MQNRRDSSVQLCTEVGGVIQQETMVDNPGSTGMVSETTEVRKTPKLSGREQAQWAMAHALEDLVGGKARLRESAEWQEELLEELVSNTKVIADVMDLFM